MFEPHEGVDGRPRGAFAPDIDRYRALRVRHECLRDVNRDRRAQGRTVVALRAFAHLQDHQCCERGPDRRIFDHVQTKAGHKCAATKLDDLALERMDLSDHFVERAADDSRPRSREHIHTEQRHAPLFPGRTRHRMRD